MICDAVIRGNFRIAQDTFRMVLECPEIARQAQAGQFVTLPVSYPLDTWRRVFTVYEVNGDQLVIVYRVVGENTKLYSRMRACQKISLAGPFGQPAIIDFTVKRFILVAGGCGLATRTARPSPTTSSAGGSTWAPAHPRGSYKPAA